MPIRFSLFRAKHLKLAKLGEDKACEFLFAKGCKILFRNYKYFKNEIDIVALDGKTICFIEVKTRKAPLKTRPASGLDEAQKKRIRHAARHYLTQIGNPALPYRFDLIELAFNRWDIVEFRYWQNNFGRNE